MQIHTQELLDRFPVRKSKKQKAEFRNWLTGVLTDAGYAPAVETGGSLVQSHNVVVGDPEQASVIFTAHYDTPARLLWPNINFPKNFLFTLLAQLPLLLIIVAVPILAETVVLLLTDNSFLGLLALELLLVVMLFMIYAGPANPHNVNDNTSGIATLLEIALTLPEEHRSKVAIVFFDNEEKGLVGSGKFKKSRKKKLDKTPLINFDCVSDGDHICFISMKKAAKDQNLASLLETSYRSTDEKAVRLLKGTYSSDQKHFPLGVGVAALRKSPFGLYLGRIHTARDTIFQEENIELLRQGSLTLAASIPVKENIAHEV